MPSSVAVSLPPNDGQGDRKEKTDWVDSFQERKV